MSLTLFVPSEENISELPAISWLDHNNASIELTVSRVLPFDVEVALEVPVFQGARGMVCVVFGLFSHIDCPNHPVVISLFFEVSPDECFS